MTLTSEKTYVLHIHFPKQASDRLPQKRLEEAMGLARAINLDIVEAEVCSLTNPSPALLIREGWVTRLSTSIQEKNIKLLVVDGTLSPVQQRNLEKKLQCKVIDRTGLILEIFGRRASTSEGSLQVELAALDYQRSRLVRSWTHLERQRGGFGFTGGPGESQLELDRRLIEKRIASLKKQLEQVKKTRGLHRKARQKVPYPVVALVGYTNAGKSTLFNYLTHSNVFSEDLLFATLDPTIRELKLPQGQKVVLSDTVGFISDLPTLLVAAFQATLEEVCEADLLLHVRDITHPETHQQKEDVHKVLKELGLEDVLETKLIEVWNKVDMLSVEELALLPTEQSSSFPCFPISATTGQGCDHLLEAIHHFFDQKNHRVTFEISLEEGKLLAWLAANSEIISQKIHESTIILEISIHPLILGRLKSIFNNRFSFKENVIP